jgi:hypothetical protein
MTDRTDILLNQDNDLLIAGGDLVTGLSDEQHIRHLLEAAPGHYKQHPMTGANAVAMVGGADQGGLRRDVRLQLLADGYSVSQIIIKDNTIHITL